MLPFTVSVLMSFIITQDNCPKGYKNILSGHFYTVIGMIFIFTYVIIKFVVQKGRGTNGT